MINQSYLYFLGLVTYIQKYELDMDTVELDVVLNDKLRYSDRCAKFVKEHGYLYRANRDMIDEVSLHDVRLHFTPKYKIIAQCVIFDSPPCYLYVAENQQQLIELFNTEWGWDYHPYLGLNSFILR